MTDGETWGDAFRSANAAAMGAYRDTLLEPVFRPWAQLLVDVTEVRSGERLLDVATGPGTVAQAAAAVLGPSGQVTACDISPAMLAIARAFPQQPDAAPIDYIESAATALPSASRSQDVVTCQQGMQFVPDRAAAIAEMSRVLRPGGRVALSVWATIEECPTMAALEQAIRDVLGDEPADRYRGGPWGMPDGASWASLLSSSGFTEVQVEKRGLRSVFPAGVAQLIASLAASGVAADVASLSEERRAALDERIADHLRPLMVGVAVEAVLYSNVATAVKPSDSESRG